jgi:amidase
LYQTTAGSSSGSASSVAAGFAPLSLGTETDGSLVQPAYRAGLYALKPTVGSMPSEGFMPIGPSFESMGGMAKAVKDLADLTGILMDRQDLAPCLGYSWKGMGVGFVDPMLWQAAALW